MQPQQSGRRSTSLQPQPSTSREDTRHVVIVGDSGDEQNSDTDTDIYSQRSSPDLLSLYTPRRTLHSLPSYLGDEHISSHDDSSN